MSYLVPSTSALQSTERTDQDVLRRESTSQRQSPHTASIDILDDDSLLNIFYLYRPFVLGEDEDEEHGLLGGSNGWDLERWWYKLAHVCQRWRKLILGSSSYLGVCLVCSKGTLVADMLAHSPPLPLVIDYFHESEYSDIAAEDEEGLTFALEQRDRIRRIRLRMGITNLQKFIMAISGEYPILEYLIIIPFIKNKAFVLSETLQAPHLRHLILSCFALPITSPLLATATGLVTLFLEIPNLTTFFQPNALLQWISFMPHLETFVIYFSFAVSGRDMDRLLSRIPIITPVTLPNLRWFWFQGGSAYLEAVVRRITTPRLEKLQVFFFEQLTFSVPHLVQFTNTTENLRFSGVTVDFSKEQVDTATNFFENAEIYLYMRVICSHLDWQVSSMAQIFNFFSQTFSAVEHLTLSGEAHSNSSEGHNEVDRTEWHKLFRSFQNVKTLRIEYGLIEEISRCLRPDDGDLPLDLFPELQEITYSGGDNADDVFASFIDARQTAGCPTTLVRHCISPYTSSSISSYETSSSGASNNSDT
ncbi:hypothetical protein F5888DRAFT_1721769 [Russula emetica]|nr:hypothetical protein F5888DRAFT_1745396 [Russula emetica]KAF8493643.1 hypothetical protein F5888DRAFT_1721769 [Russula emetica]